VLVLFLRCKSTVEGNSSDAPPNTMISVVNLGQALFLGNEIDLTSYGDDKMTLEVEVKAKFQSHI
jgi:hypothetical protein